MKLKLIVASMSILGMIATPALANHKHKHHCKKADTTVAAAAPEDYKGYKDAVCTISTASMTMDQMTQNVGRALPNPCNPGWFNRIQVSGGVNVDMGKWGNRNANIMGENYQRLSLNDAYLNVSANVNDWTKAFASLSYNTATTNANPGIYKGLGVSEYSAAYSNNIYGTGNNNIQVEQAFATFGNFDMSPIFLQVGKQFQDFSRYEIHPITASMTQVMSETLATSIKLGFIYAGFNGSVFLFDDPISKTSTFTNTFPTSPAFGSSSTTTNYGASLGFDMPNDQFGWDLGVSYLYNMIGVNDIAYNVVNFTNTNAYRTRVGGVAAYGDVNAGPFSVALRYTTSIDNFNVNDLPKNGVGDRVGNNIAGATIAGRNGAEPWAAGIQVGYGFDAWTKTQNIFVGYQASGEAAGLNLPSNRWVAGYNIDWWKNTNFGLEWDHDSAYSVAHGGTGNTTNLVTLRAAVKFA